MAGAHGSTPDARWPTRERAINARPWADPISNTSRGADCAEGASRPRRPMTFRTQLSVSGSWDSAQARSIFSVAISASRHRNVERRPRLHRAHTNRPCVSDPSMKAFVDARVAVATGDVVRLDQPMTNRGDHADTVLSLEDTSRLRNFFSMDSPRQMQ